MMVDKLTMARSVEACVPFLDHLLTWFSVKLPPFSAQMKGWEHKYVLKRVVHDLLPEQVLKKKLGFGVPISEYLSGEMRELAKNELEERDLPIFKKSYVMRLIRSHLTRSLVDSSFRFWALLNFSLWHRYWIERENIAP